ncbi:hypothetical protein L218DRAFT_650879, partial [Marasmius fiardii PR-910]
QIGDSELWNRTNSGILKQVRFAPNPPAFPHIIWREMPGYSHSRSRSPINSHRRSPSPYRPRPPPQYNNDPRPNIGNMTMTVENFNRTVDVIVELATNANRALAAAGNNPQPPPIQYPVMYDTDYFNNGYGGSGGIRDYGFSHGCGFPHAMRGRGRGGGCGAHIGSRSRAAGPLHDRLAPEAEDASKGRKRARRTRKKKIQGEVQVEDGQGDTVEDQQMIVDGRQGDEDYGQAEEQQSRTFGGDLDDPNLRL